MKTLFFFFLVTLMITIFPREATAQKAKVPPRIVRVEKGSQSRTLTVQLANLLGARTEIFIIDGRGKSWFSKFIERETGYHLLLDFTPLPEGDYLLQIANRYGRTLRAFHLQDAALTFFEPGREAEKRLVSYDSRPEGRLIAQFEAAGPRTLALRLANLKQQPATIDIISVDGFSVFEANVSEENGFAHPLNLEGMAPGDYFVYVVQGDAAVFQFFHLRENNLELIPPVQMGDVVIAKAKTESMQR